MFILSLIIVYFSSSRVLSLSTDVVDCFESGECKLENVCGFDLPSGIKEGRCYKRNCKNLTGHIMKIRSNLDFDVIFNWDVLKAIDSEEAKKKGLVKSTRLVHVPKYGVKYFDTGFIEIHTIRLYVGGEPVAILKSSSNECPSGFRTCQYLVRVCYDPYDNEAAETHLNSTNSGDSVEQKKKDENLYSPSKYVSSKRCGEYSRHCHGFDIKETSQERSCVFDCVSTFDPLAFEALATQNIDNEKLKKCMIYASGGHVSTKEENSSSGALDDVKILTSTYWGYEGCGTCQDHNENDGSDNHGALLVSISVVIILLFFAIFFGWKMYGNQTIFGHHRNDHGTLHHGKTTL